MRLTPSYNNRPPSFPPSWKVRRAVYLDVDMILAGDIQELWRYFNEFNKDHTLLYYMGNNHPEGHNRRRLLRPYCSCQLVMELDRMRAANTTKVSTSSTANCVPHELYVNVRHWVCSFFCDYLYKDLRHHVYIFSAIDE